MNAKKNSIKTRLIQKVLLVSVFIIALITAFETYVSFINNLSQLDRVDWQVRETFLLPISEGVWLLDRDDIVSHMELILSLPQIELVRVEIKHGETIDVGEVSSAEEKTYTYQLVREHNKQLVEIGSLSVFAGLDSIYHQAKIHIITSLLGNSVIVFLVAFLVVFLTRNLITRHLVDISNNLDMSCMTSPEAPPLTLNRVKSEATQGDELETVVDAINNMRTTLIASYEEMHQSQQRLRQITDNSEMWIWEVDRDGLYTYCSNACEYMFGYSVNEIVGEKHFYDFFHPEDKDHLKVAAFEMFEKRVPFKEFVNRNVNRLGETVWLSTTGVPIVDDNGNHLGYRGADIDVTERKRAEDERMLLTENLKVKNAELERFVYTASHDLKTPLVTIRGFSGVLKDRFGQSCDDDILSSLNFIDSAAKKMNNHLNDLLAYSRSGHLPLKKETVSLNELVQEVMREVELLVDDRHVRCEISNILPEVFGDRSQLLQVMLNLVENAVKYMGEQLEPVIEIGAVATDEGLACYVRDNGLGILPEYHKSVFGLFQRLSNDKKGTGVGLALVKQIIERHEGKVWVESSGEPGKGSTFWFTLNRV